MVQAGIGIGYAQQIIASKIADFLSQAGGTPPAPVNLDVRIAFNPNITTAWFTSVMGVVGNGRRGDPLRARAQDALTSARL
jgi:ABC-2 type transport system permease protein